MNEFASIQAKTRDTKGASSTAEPEFCANRLGVAFPASAPVPGEGIGERYGQG